MDKRVIGWCINEKRNDFVSCFVGFGYHRPLCMWRTDCLVLLDGQISAVQSASSNQFRAEYNTCCISDMGIIAVGNEIWVISYDAVVWN